MKLTILSLAVLFMASCGNNATDDNASDMDTMNSSAVTTPMPSNDASMSTADTETGMNSTNNAGTTTVGGSGTGTGTVDNTSTGDTSRGLRTR